MEEDELVVFVVSIIAALVGKAATTSQPLHRLAFRQNAALGLMRLAVPLAMAWIAFVLWRFADPSVTGIYIVFYLVMGYALVAWLGQLFPGVYGVRLRVDVYERKNLAAAIVLFSFTIATGLIFGGSLWGEADPLTDDEGGWWIPLGFFILGWSILAVAVGLYAAAERGNLGSRIRQGRSVYDARAAASYILSTAVVVTEAVAGDFFGWAHGLASLGLIAGMLVLHELIARMRVILTTQRDGQPRPTRRIIESVLYASAAIGFWLLHRTWDL